MFCRDLSLDKSQIQDSPPTVPSSMLCTRRANVRRFSADVECARHPAKHSSDAAAFLFLATAESYVANLPAQSEKSSRLLHDLVPSYTEAHPHSAHLSVTATQNEAATSCIEAVGTDNYILNHNRVRMFQTHDGNLSPAVSPAGHACTNSKPIRRCHHGGSTYKTSMSMTPDTLYVQGGLADLHMSVSHLKAFLQDGENPARTACQELSWSWLDMNQPPARVNGIACTKHRHRFPSSCSVLHFQRSMSEGLALYGPLSLLRTRCTKPRTDSRRS